MAIMGQFVLVFCSAHLVDVVLVSCDCIVCVELMWLGTKDTENVILTVLLLSSYF